MSGEFNYYIVVQLTSGSLLETVRAKTRTKAIVKLMAMLDAKERMYGCQNNAVVSLTIEKVSSVDE